MSVHREGGTFASNEKKVLRSIPEWGGLGLKQTLFSRALLEKNMVGKGMVC